MARNQKAVEHNDAYLKEIVGKGKLVGGRYFAFEGIYSDGTTCKYCCDFETGIVVRMTEDGKVKTFGAKEKSGDKRGYMNVEMVSPYDAEVFAGTKENNIYRDSEGNIIGVQFTCYIHQLMCIAKYIAEGKEIGEAEDTNHKDGCKMHNWASNLERVSRRLNGLHGTILTSIKHNKQDEYLTTDSNKKVEFVHLNREVSAYDVEEYMSINSEFRMEVEECYLMCLGKPMVYQFVSPENIDSFMDWLDAKYNVAQKVACI